jgi:hypothetical protein
MRAIICKKTNLVGIKREKQVRAAEDLREFVAAQINLRKRTAPK